VNYAIRPARDEDGRALAALIGGCWAEYPGCNVPVEEDIPEIHALASDYASKGGALWVAEADGIIGMMGVKPHESAAWEISRIYVAAEARGIGLAQELLALAEDYARAQGAARAVLWSDTRFLRAHRFYEKQGFVRIGGIRVLHDQANSLEFRYEKPLSGIAALRLDAAAIASAADGLAGVLVACVADGAPLGFRAPLDRMRALVLFEELARAVAEDGTRLIAGWADGRLAGCAALRWNGREIEPHVGELCRLMVAPWARRRGLGRALLEAAEQAARDDGRRIIYLFAADHGVAPLFYGQNGYRESGRIPQAGGLPDGGLVDTLIFTKQLSPQE
jgi:GNAT superfamily N-acetyltransferase